MFYTLNKFERESKKEKHTIKEWELNTGIKIIEPKGFIGARNKIRTNLYTRKAFKRGTKASIMTVKTEKGLEFINSL